MNAIIICCILYMVGCIILFFFDNDLDDYEEIGLK